MITIKPFKAYRPAEAYVQEVADLPYDVVTDEEVRQTLKVRPYSFLKVDKPEAWCKNKDEVSVAKAAGEALTELMEEKILLEDEEQSLYIYGLESKWGKQYGIVGCFSCSEYEKDLIKKHEKTRADKEADRVRHVAACKAHTGPIFLTCKEDKTLEEWINGYIKEEQPVYDFIDEASLRQVVYRICDVGKTEEVVQVFKQLEALYVADGHHRLQAASTYAKQCRMDRSKEEASEATQEEYEYFLGVVFPKSELTILDYNRVLKDESGLSEEALMKALEEYFVVNLVDEELFKPEARHTFGMRYKKKWYALKAKQELIDEKNVVERLDTSILQKKVLEPIFKIQDPRTDKRMDFVGGIKGIKALNDLTDERWDIAFSLYPTSIEELIDVADEGELMPPKSTWFEPKLRSGLFIHKF